MAGRSGDSGINGLAELPDNHQIIPNALAERTKNLLPGRWEHAIAIPESPWNIGP